MKTDYIDLYQVHWPDTTTAFEETMEAFEKLIQRGKIRYAGVSNYNLEQFIEANKYTNVVSNQLPYSMIKREIENDLVPYCIEANKSILAYSPLGRGILTGKLKAGHQFAEGDHRAGMSSYSNENIVRINEFLAKLQLLADAKNATISQLVIRWTLDQSGITIALVGARNAS